MLKNTKNMGEIKVFGCFIVCLFVLFIIGGCATTSTIQTSNEPIRIGVLTPLTGDASPWGIPPKQGAELAHDLLGGGIGDRLVKIFYEDSKCDSKQAVSAVHKLTNIHRVDVIIGAVCSSSTLAIAPIVEAAGIPLISPASTSPKITNAGDYIFRVVPTDALRSQVFAKYVFDKGISNVAILYINNDGGKGIAVSFTGAFENLGGKVVVQESYAESAKDVKTQLMKIQSKNPEAIVISSYQKDTVLVMKQVKELGIKTPLYFATEAVEDSSVVKTAGNAAESAVYILAAEAKGSIVDKFKTEYKLKFGNLPELYAAEGFDAYVLIYNSVKKCNGLSQRAGLSKCVKDVLYGVENFKGVSGKISFDLNGDVKKPMAIKKIVDGKRIVIAEV